MSTERDLEEQVLSSIIFDGERLGLIFMGDDIIGYKFVGGPKDMVYRWNLVLERIVSDAIEFTDEFFERRGITPAPYDSQKWNEHNGY